MSRSVSVDLMKILEDYVGDVDRIVEESAKEAADIASSQLKNTSPYGPGRKGHYRNGWTVKPRREGSLVSFIVYNKNKPQLTHLLENGHVVRPTPTHPNRKGRVAGIKHIKPVEEWANEEFQLRISRGLS